MLELQEIGTERSLHLYRTLAKTFKSVNEHAVSGSKVHGFNPTAYGVLEVLYMKGAQPIQQVGAQLLLQSGNVTYVIDKLEQKDSYLQTLSAGQTDYICGTDRGRSPDHG